MMNKYILITLAAILTACQPAQTVRNSTTRPVTASVAKTTTKPVKKTVKGQSNVKVPEVVQNAFTKKYPGMTPTWEKKLYGYEGIFFDQGIEYEGEFDANGVWLETEYEVNPVVFSQQVIKRVQQENPGYQITKYEIEITPQGKFYEVEIERGSEQIELYFNQNAQPARNFYEDA